MAPPPSPGIIGLTTVTDTIVAPASGATVYGTAATLNAGDSLTGGVGTDVLDLIGSGPGSFRIDQLVSFSGFEKIKLDNPTSSFANLTLNSQPIEVDATGYVSIYVDSPSNWNVSNIIEGDPARALAGFAAETADVESNFRPAPDTLRFHARCELLLVSLHALLSAEEREPGAVTVARADEGANRRESALSRAWRRFADHGRRCGRCLLGLASAG